MTKQKAREIVATYISEHGDIPSVFSDLKLAKAVLILGEEEIERMLDE